MSRSVSEAALCGVMIACAHDGGGHPTEEVEFPNPVGSADRADTAHPRISISGVRRVELIAASDPTDRRMLGNRVVDGKRVVPGDSEDVVGTNFL